MNSKHFYALAAMAALALPAFSRPASPELQRHTNPDGSHVEFRINGDENFNYLTTADGSMLLEMKGKTLTPMIRNGKQLIANQANLSMLEAELPKVPELTAKSAGKVHRMAALDGYGRSTYPTTGNVRACVILLEYADTPFTSADPLDQFTRLCNEKGYSDFGSCGSAKDYYEACSGGKFIPTFDVYGPVKLEHEARWYVGADDPSLLGYQHNARFGVAIKEALEALDPDVDFSVYDYDEDGIIDNIFFFYSGYGQADTGNKDLVWPHQGNFYRYTSIYGDKIDGKNTIGLKQLFVDGKEMLTYACSCELNGSAKIPANKRPYIDGIGAFCHEYGHVLGLPDVYDTYNSGTRTPKDYSVMDSGSYNGLSTCPPLFSAYEMWVCNWLEFDTPEEGAINTLNALSTPEANAYRLRIPRPGTNRYYNEFYVLECRNKDGWDSTIPGQGMLIWHINYDPTAWANNSVNVNKNPRIELIGQGGTTNYAWPGEMDPTTFISQATGELTTISTHKPLNAVLTDISYDYTDPNAKVATFGYNMYSENSLTTVLHSAPQTHPENYSFTLNWDAVPEATDYQLSLRRRTSAGAEYVVNSLNETSVGNVTSYTVNNLTETQWKQTFTAYVRVVAGLPSTATSNKLVFIPANITEDTGVDGIYDGSIPAIFGGKGEIIAPEGARVFNLSGVETGTQNLAPGVYLVVAPGISAKVVVK